MATASCGGRLVRDNGPGHGRATACAWPFVEGIGATATAEVAVAGESRRSPRSLAATSRAAAASDALKPSWRVWSWA